jgi:hypothetical protein
MQQLKSPVGMTEDIRDRAYLNQKDILSLNFIKSPGIYHFRRHYREGLRSHIMEILTNEALKNETKGIVIEGSRLFPRAMPLKMLRIFKTKFNTLADAMDELARVKTIAKYLLPDHIAKSQEFLVDYINEGKREILLCGLQAYVKGLDIDPWSLLDKTHLISLFDELGFKKDPSFVEKSEKWIYDVKGKAENFIAKLKKMILEAHYVPDLAGVGNLLLTAAGDIKLVDINNISEVILSSNIRLDDRGYPVCDKSIEALSLLEEKLIGKPTHKDDLIYKIFLDPARMEEVKKLEKRFHLSMKSKITYSD